MPEGSPKTKSDPLRRSKDRSAPRRKVSASAQNNALPSRRAPRQRPLLSRVKCKQSRGAESGSVADGTEVAFEEWRPVFTHQPEAGRLPTAQKSPASVQAVTGGGRRSCAAEKRKPTPSGTRNGPQKSRGSNDHPTDSGLSFWWSRVRTCERMASVRMTMGLLWTKTRWKVDDRKFRHATIVCTEAVQWHKRVILVEGLRTRKANT